ncbi:MAG: hypothetical protein E6J88_02125 [Deltaproteobacteria bacterium]|nr:MAG: hypothetical protein E6J88_02125 [Deltaproteobacteria bacterium]
MTREVGVACAGDQERERAFDDRLLLEQHAADVVQKVTMLLASKGMAGDRDGMMLHSFDYLDLFGTAVIAWQWLLQAAAAKEGLRKRDEPFYRGKLAAAQHWIRAELPRIHHLADLITDGEDSYAAVAADWF